MLTRDKLEYQKRLRFLREARAKTASEQLKLAKTAEESDLTKPMVTLGDKENRVPARGETPKAYNEVPKTRETSRVKDPLEAGDKGDNVLDIDLSDLDYAKISEQKRFYIKRVGREERNEPYSGPEMKDLDIEPQFYSDEAEAGTVADMLIDLDPHGMEDFYVANLEDEPLEPEEDEETLSDEEFEDMLMREVTPQQEDADQSLARMKKRKKATRTKNIKRKSHAKLSESNLDSLLRECGCEMESPFDAPEDEPQGYMLKQSLEKIGSQATDLSNVANHDDDPEPWVEFKVTSAAEQIDAVHDYIKYGRKHRSDMSGHEDMHSGDEMMNEKVLRKLIRKIILEQPINLATGAPAPTTTPVAPAAPAAAQARPASAYRRGMSPEFQGAVNEIFSTDPTSRSLMNHLTRMLRGIQTNNAGVADGELANNQPYVNNTLRRRIPLIKAQRPDLSAVADELAAQVTTFNTPALPRALAQITNKPQVVAKIQALINWLRTNQNRFSATAPDTSPTPSPTPSITPEQESRARADINNIVQQFNEYVRGIENGTPDLSVEGSPERATYLQRLDVLATQRAAAYVIVYKRAAELNRNNAIRQIDARIATVRQQITQNQTVLQTAQFEAQRLGTYLGTAGAAAEAGSALGREMFGGVGAALGGLAGGAMGLTTPLDLTGIASGMPLRIARNAVYARTAVARFLQNELNVLESIKVYVSNPNATPPPVRLPSGTSMALAIPSATSTTSTPAPEASGETATAASPTGMDEGKKVKLGRLFRFI